MVNKSKLTDKEFIKSEHYFTLAGLKKSVDWAIQNANLNHQNPDDILVILNNESTFKEYLMSTSSFGFNGDGKMYFSMRYYDRDQIDYSDPDIRPEYGEYWKSRGVGGGECSGFVNTKEAGERIMRYIKAILETDTPKTRLDYREHEPNWIQLKFSEDEFDLELLDSMTTNNDNVITYEIMVKCKK